MLRTKNLAMTAVAVLFTALPARSEVLTFDDITTGLFAPIPNGYGGFEWSNMAVMDSTRYFFPTSGIATGVVSGNYVAFNNNANVGSIWGETFDFNGAFFTAAWNDGLNITVEGYYQDELLYSQTVIVDTAGPTWFDFNYAGIDRLRIESFGGTNAGHGDFGTQFVIDDFTFNEPIESSEIEVEIAVQPGDESKPINLNSRGDLPVAILSTHDFDALDVDVETVRLGDPDLVIDGDGWPAAPIDSLVEDVNGNGFPDLVLFFSIGDLVEEGALDQETVELLLVGETFDGVAIFGTDEVSTFQPGTGPPPGKGPPPGRGPPPGAGPPPGRGPNR